MNDVLHRPVARGLIVAVCACVMLPAYVGGVGFVWRHSSLSGGHVARHPVVGTPCERILSSWREYTTRMLVAAESPMAPGFARAAEGALSSYAEDNCPFADFLVAGVAARESAAETRRSGGLRAN